MERYGKVGQRSDVIAYYKLKTREGIRAHMHLSPNQTRLHRDLFALSLPLTLARGEKPEKQGLRAPTGLIWSQNSGPLHAHRHV